MSEINESNFTLYAAQHYINDNCIDQQEFDDDLSRIKYIKRLLKKYVETGEIKERLILNHIIVLYNVFDNVAMTKILVYKLPEYLPQLKTFLTFLNFWPQTFSLNNNIIHSKDISIDYIIEQTLRKI